MVRKLLILALSCLTLPMTKAQYVPGPTLAADMQNLTVNLVSGYETKHPRCLFYAEDKAAITAKTQDANVKQHWTFVYMGALGLSTVPSASEIQSGNTYYRVPRILAGALYYFVTGNETVKNNAIAWMKAHCQVAIWGTGYGENVDIAASYYLYFISLAYDILYDQISTADKTIIQQGLKDHAIAIYGHVQDMGSGSVRYDQNHTYMPTVALMSAGLALKEVYTETAEWIKLSYAMMRRCRYVLGPDGYYYEGTGYWAYAMHWHLRYADLISRATGEDAYDMDIFRNNYLFALHNLFPGAAGSFDIGDGNGGSANAHLGYGLAKAFRDTLMQAAADMRGIQYDADAYHHTAAFFWFDPALASADQSSLVPYHYFNDHELVFWRSGWEADATACVFKCGPPQGHQAAQKLKQLTDWYRNDGHTHPDIGMFWMHARGKYLAKDTGYLCEKRTRDHNTILIDNKGMGNDGSYWVYRNRSYDDFDKARITHQYLDNEYGYSRGDFSTVYTDITGNFGIVRQVVMTKDYLLVADDLSADGNHAFSWLLHAENTFTQSGDDFTTQSGDVSLKVKVLSEGSYTPAIDAHTLAAGTSPGQCTPEQRGYLLKLSSPSTAQTSFLTILVPLGTGDSEPVVEKWESSDSTACLKIAGNGYTDYFGVSLGDSGSRSVTNPQDSQETVSWSGPYCFIRVKGSQIIASGTVAVSNLKVTGVASARLNGEATGFTAQGSYTEFPGPLPVKDDRNGLLHKNDQDLLQIQPNPFKGKVTISCGLRAGEHLTPSITIHDMEGNTIKTLNSKANGVVSWDGSDTTGNKVSPGVYFCRLKSGDSVAVRPVIYSQK